MPTIIPDQLTRLTLEEAIAAFLAGWRRVLKRDPTPGALAVLVAGSALETGHWRSMHCYCFGNIKASPNYPGLACMFTCDEIVTPEQGEVAKRLGPCTVGPWAKDPSKVRVVVHPPHPWSAFRAYRTAAEGAAAHIEFLAVDTDGDGKNRYAATWAAVERGDAVGYVRAKKAVGYFTGPLDAYEAAVRAIAAKILGSCRAALEVSEPEQLRDEGLLDDNERERIEGLVMLTLDQAARGELPRDDHDTDPAPPPESQRTA